MDKKSQSSPNFLSVKLTCPECGHEYTRKVRIPEPQIKVRKVECLKCGKRWVYRGMLKSRIRCPKCHSSKNEVNRKEFGRFELQ